MDMWQILTQESWSPLNDPNWQIPEQASLQKFADRAKEAPTLNELDDTWSAEDRDKLFSFMDGVVAAYNGAAFEFEVEVEVSMIFTGYTHGRFKTRGLVQALKRLEPFGPYLDDESLESDELEDFFGALKIFYLS